MNKIDTSIGDDDRKRSDRKSSANLAKEALDNLRHAVPFSLTFIEGVRVEDRQHIEAQLKEKFELWANTWIAPDLRSIIAKGKP